jgi:hypothetical protein
MRLVGKSLSSVLGIHLVREEKRVEAAAMEQAALPELEGIGGPEIVIAKTTRLPELRLMRHDPASSVRPGSTP